jgi:endonuclease/exonuclease/phosphatase family metal-dependent hydrolase
MLIRPLVAAVVLAGATLISPALTPPASAATLDIAVAEWNMCGAACYNGSTTPADIIYFFVAGQNPRPWLVSLNEVCFNSSQLQRLRGFLDDLGYHDNTYAARQPGVAGCGGAAFGNVVFALGNRVSASTYQFPSQDSSAEKRGVVCNINSGFLGNWQACSTHLDNDSGKQFQQVNELFNVMALGGNMLSIVGGDFNMTPGSSQLNQWRSAYDEIDEVSPFSNTTDSHGKIDYIWARDVGNMSSPYAPVTDPIDGSDHHIYSGRFRISF